MDQRIIIIDYGMGNLNSIKRKLSILGIDAIITNIYSEISNSDKLILPGVGHFYQAVKNLKQMNIWEALNDAVLIKGTPILGICLGMQLMAKHSEEGDIDGLGWLDAEVVRFHMNDFISYKVPHIGWNKISKLRESELMKDIPDLSEFYFVHSYYFNCNDPSDILNETEYEKIFTSAVEKGNIFGVQYHPEKSHDVGIQVLKNFINL
jgi:glutamine amidotransferase